MSRQCGYIALLGRPNAGKSTLLNALVGDKLAVVSRKPQTTRNRILGVLPQGDAQLLFLDTPGLHKDKGKNLLNTVMNRLALQVAHDADLLVYLVDATQGFTGEDSKFLSRILKANPVPWLVLATKWDLPNRKERGDKLLNVQKGLDAFLSETENAAFASRLVQPEVKPVSAKRPEDVRELRSMFADLLPEGDWLFPEDDLTDMPRSFVCAELIREQVFRQLGQEVPYGSAVKVSAIEAKGDLTLVTAQIVVSRSSHKGMVVGKGGARIKAIGSLARESLEKHFEGRVYLDLSVTVAEGWMDDQRLIAELAMVDELALGTGREAKEPPAFS